MENNIETLHIEFYGLPGSGKSTISHELGNYLIEKDYKIVEKTHEMSHSMNQKIRICKKIIESIAYALIHPKRTKSIYKQVKKNNYKKAEKVIQIINILPKMLTYTHPKKNTIYLWDEGLIQSALSLSFS